MAKTQETAWAEALAVPTPWLAGTIEAEHVARPEGYRIVLTAYTDTGAGRQDFSIGIVLDAASLTEILTGLTRPCQIRVYDVEDTEAADA